MNKYAQATEDIKAGDILEINEAGQAKPWKSNTADQPTDDEAEHFLKCLQTVPSSYFSNHKDPTSSDYGTCFTSYYKMMDWLEYKFNQDRKRSA